MTIKNSLIQDLNYLKYMDNKKEKDVEKYNNSKYTFNKSQYYTYSKIFFSENLLNFKTEFVVVKLSETTILLRDKISGIKIYLSDNDINGILCRLKKDNNIYYNYLELYMNSITDLEKLNKIEYYIEEEKMCLYGIPFLEQTSEYLIVNRANILITENDFIGLLNLIFEKERQDKDKNKLIETVKNYLFQKV